MSEENERYARADVQGGYLYNKSEIDYFKQTQALDVVANLMLGDFNKKGSYVLSQGIIEELVKVKKVYQYSFGSTTFCQSMNDVGGFGKIDFAIKIRSNNQNGTVAATLQLLETIDRANGYYQNTNTASIATFTEKESNTFIVNMLKHFNVVSKKDEGFLKKDKAEEDISLIVARKKYEELLKKGSEEKIDAAYKSLYEKRLKMLARSEVGKKILAEFNSESYKINGWFVKEGMLGYYRYLNQVLDGLFEVHSEEVLQDVALTASWRKSAEVASADFAKIMSSADRALANSANEAMIEQQKQSKLNTMGVEVDKNAQPRQEEQQKAEVPKPQPKQEAKNAKVAVEVDKPVVFDEAKEQPKPQPQKPEQKKEKVLSDKQKSLLAGLGGDSAEREKFDQVENIKKQEDKQDLAAQLVKAPEETEEKTM